MSAEKKSLHFGEFDAEYLPQDLRALKDALSADGDIPILRDQESDGGIRATLAHVKDKASEYGLGNRLTIYRGELDARGVSVRHLWIVESRGYVIDPNFPLHNPEFLGLLVRFTMDSSDVSMDELRALPGQKAGFSERVFGDIPDGYEYYGAPVLSAAYK